MKNLMILVKMQLKERLNFKRLNLKDVKLFSILLSVLAAVLKFALVAALCGVIIFVAKFLGLFSLTNNVPSSVISIIFSLMMLTSILSCTVGLTKSLYYSRDNMVLLTLPAPFIRAMFRTALSVVRSMTTTSADTTASVDASFGK